VIDVLIYWRDYRQNWTSQSDEGDALYWHSNARMFEQLEAGDRLWLVTAGRNIDGFGDEAPQVGFLVGVWPVQRVIANPGDDPTYPSGTYRYRVVADASASMLFDEPVLVDQILRPPGRDKTMPIGRFLQGPRRLKDDKVRLLRSAAGAQMAKHYLTGRQT